MINLKFNNLKIEGFQSLGKAEISFNDLGTCFIKGINQYDNKTKSNGSGKTSLMSSIIWCLFGKTPAGIGNDVVNKFYDNGCFVELNLDVDGMNYTIRRSQKHKTYKTDLVVLKDSEDISGRNKTDSDKLIQKILQIDNEVFLQMIFLSQGFANRFAVYTPKARKDLLESLYNIDEKLISFVDMLKIKEGLFKTDIDKLTNVNLELKTKVYMRENNIETYNSKISLLNEQISKLESTTCGITKADIEKLQTEIDTLEKQKTTISEKINAKQSSIIELKSDIGKHSDIIGKAKNEIAQFSNNKVCPTCGTVLENYEKNDHIQKHLSELSVVIESEQANVFQLTKTLDDEKAILNKMSVKMSNIESKKSNLNALVNDKIKLYEAELQKETQIEALKNNVNDYYDSINKLTNDNTIDMLETANNEHLLEIKNRELLILQHSIRLANNQFKSYLLENIITSLNNKLKELSMSLFENEIIQISGDAKLDIVLGEKIYEQLSGGEQRKVDIAIIIAQRFLAQQMNSISSNILILDEVFDGCDSESFKMILEVLDDEFKDIDSVFIISHRDESEIPFDNVITVIKDKNQISRIDFT